MFDKKRFYFFRLIFSTVSIVKKGKKHFSVFKNIIRITINLDSIFTHMQKLVR